MRKIIYIILFFLWAIPSGFAQLKTYSFEEVVQLSKENPKPIVVFTHTNWCKYCKIMEHVTFKDSRIIATLNENFYFVSFDAETKKDIIFNNHTFQFQPNGTNTGIHELAIALATIENQIVYPTLTILESDNSILFQQASFISAKALGRILDKLK
ncbi:thioredoxin family protein [Flavobacterium galactosidilyticum]|uniref:thioredoxin family protein n=1 Tax=Flavobacterium galactosidilyticum TaxID=2893886 RepID=UPI001E314348|nr:thioredoxin family protein [Flavobacterium sp. F-340]UFH47121.1 thioredoxin family protein [Flavobacterium sp. F-340]